MIQCVKCEGDDWKNSKQKAKKTVVREACFLAFELHFFASKMEKNEFVLSENLNNFVG